MIRAVPYAGILGAIVFAAAVIGFGLALPGYSQVWHPVAVLGAQGVPHATAFNLLGFMLPGLLAGLGALALRQRLPGDAGWRVRIGAQLLFLSTLGLLALGLLPLDPRDLHNPASSYHATAWMLWWVAFVPGAALLATGLRGRPGWRDVSRSGLAAALAVLLVVLVAVEFLPAGLAQRAGFGIWWIWLAWLAWRVTRAAPRAA